MDFGDILDEWDRETAKPHGKKRIAEDARRGGERTAQEPPANPRVNPMDAWLRRYGTEDKDSLSADSPARETPAERRARLRAKRCDAVIDLHGLTRDDAWIRLESFFAGAVRQGLEKVLIIHGKGTHSADDPVLGPMVRVFLERNPHSGESGHSGKEAGGTGSTWVILK
jgi:DNA-nicking Smr family endonuclease